MLVTGFAAGGGLGVEGVAGAVSQLGGRRWTLAGLGERPPPTGPGRPVKVSGQHKPECRCYHRQALAGRDAGGLPPLQP